ncbi:MAG TPA: hypothetical protein PLR76_06795 [Hyphomonas sp.]|nr:hypothetical protein [Hyphomonas sp.]
MILSRVIEHVKAQHWTAVFLDFVIVVLGVFIGLQVQDWNTARAARTELNHQLVGFRIELEENQAHFSEYRAELTGQMEDVAAMRAAFKSGAASIDAEEISARLVNVARVKVFAPDLAALTELRDSGGLRRLADKDIRAAITDWERSLAEVSRKYGDGLRERDTVLIPYMMQNIAYGPLLEKSSLVADTVGVSKFRNDFAALADSREFDNQIAYRYGNCGSTIHSLDKLDVETAQLVEALRAREATQ